MASGTRRGDSNPGRSLLTAHDPPPVEVINPDGASSFLLLGDHAGNAIPVCLGTLGLGQADLVRHIAWDIGVDDLGTKLATRLDATFIRQNYSRLVVDCNRHPGASDAFAEISDGIRVPGNQALSQAACADRLAAIHEPYQQAIAGELRRRDATGRHSVLVALHSFTPVLGARPRPWEIGVMYDGGATGFARRLLARLQCAGRLTVGDNEPYRLDDTDYVIPRHAYPVLRDYVEIEIRQDLLDTPDKRTGWALLLVDALKTA